MKTIKNKLIELFELALYNATKSYDKYPQPFRNQPSGTRQSIDDYVIKNGEPIRDVLNLGPTDDIMYHNQDEPTMVITFKNGPILFILPIQHWNLIKKVKPKENKTQRKILGIPVGKVKTTYEFPEVDEVNYRDEFINGEYYVYTKTTKFIICQGQVMAELNEDEYIKCIETHKRNSVRIDMDILDKRLKELI